MNVTLLLTVGRVLKLTMDDIGSLLTMVDTVWCAELNSGLASSDSVVAELMGWTCGFDCNRPISVDG